MATLSVNQIADRLITYFANRFGDPPEDFTQATNVKTTYRFSALAWAELADVLSKLQWMRNLKVRLKQGEMNSVPRIGQLATLIWNHANKPANERATRAAAGKKSGKAKIPKKRKPKQAAGRKARKATTMPRGKNATSER